ncbi:hypothetical protein B0T19DRAFT_113798 [Cercophora scortea]|uniref:CBM-cenC domain-containing protein n=1 Tax=Cercophora scortea TaxID=314031 RepID=A0AAE0IX82_9PEZI|nr:hypothetical protein B0T19DRAFT_113798 [Cercophora scortea]
MTITTVTMPSKLSSILVLALSLTGANAAACAADNCYNQLARHTPSASAFCATFTTATVTAITALPTYISTSCGTSRVSSACSCLWPRSASTTSTTSAPGTTTVTVTVTATACPTSTNLLKNPAIPGLAPWYNGDIILSTSYGYNNPQIALSAGSPSGGAFLISFPADGQFDFDQRLPFPNKPTKYTMTFWAQSPNPASCWVLPSIGTVGTGLYEGSPFGLSTAWTQYSITYTTNGDTDGFVAIATQCQSGTDNKVYLDQISLVLA